MLLKTEIKDRLELRETIAKKIYATRSKIVHFGGNIVSEAEKSQLAYLRVIARDLLAILIERIDEFEDRKGFLNWILRQKLTS